MILSKENVSIRNYNNEAIRVYNPYILRTSTWSDDRFVIVVLSITV